LKSSNSAPPGWVLIADGWMPGDVVYLHKLGAFNVTRLYEIAREAALICGPFQVAVPPVEMLERDSNVDKAKALAIPLHVATAEPLLCIQMMSRHLLVIDGHHRLLRMVCAGIVTFKSYIVPPGFQSPLVTPQTRQLAACTDKQLAARISGEDLKRFLN
jgi:hypothetical protein